MSTQFWLAEFENAERVIAAARWLDGGKCRLVDAFTPFPIAEINARVVRMRSRIGLVMLIAGLGVAALAYGVQWYSAVISYPIDVGGRPLNSWQVFLLVPFETGMLAAAVAGFIMFLAEGGLTRLHDPVFAVPAFERASQDRYFLLVEPAADDADEATLRHALRQAGAVSVSQVPS
ncbi:MAG: DUF3341 domain-containing protein [Xanthobacteraceae bacterium]